jgi:RNA polymerase sigma-70 factor (ECF subfamily)
METVLTETAAPAVEHLFRRQAGRMVSHFTRLLGPAYLNLAEDAVQEAMLRALQTWQFAGMPENAVAWLYRTAHNVAIDAIRRNRLFDEKSEGIVAALYQSAATSPTDPDCDEQLRDDELRMIILCCHPALTRSASVALSLKTVGGFSVREIARAFLADETAIAQRLVRAKRQIRESPLSFEMPRGAELQDRLLSVLDVIYFMFNEGYSAHEGKDLIRTDLCMEALRLGRLVAASSMSTPTADALVALIALQAARLRARVDDVGDLVQLESQDRSLWDQKLISMGFYYFDRSMTGNQVSEYHVQAAIAATHARALNGRLADWSSILRLYDQLLAINPSPIVVLNRAVAMSKAEGPAPALAAIEGLDRESKLGGYHLLLAVRGHFLEELGRHPEAAACFRAALECPCSEPEQRFLRRKLRGLIGPPPL